MSKQQKRPPFLGSAEAGTTLVESLIAATLLLAVFAGLGYQVRSMRAQMNETARVMAIDALEGSLIDLVRDPKLVAHSLKLSGRAALRNCFAGTGTCIHDSKYEVPLVRQGQTTAFTGMRYYYDRNAVPCEKTRDCEKPRLALRSIINPKCIEGSSCKGADFTLIITEIYNVETGKILRKFAQEIQLYGDRKFPGLRLGCSDPSSVLHGIGLKGEALCTPVSEIVFKDKSSKVVSNELKVKPVDCSAQNKAAQDQFVVQGIGSDGTISCASRFW